MSYKQPTFEFMILLASIVVSAVVLILICCYRGLQKLLHEFDEEKPNPKSVNSVISDSMSSEDDDKKAASGVNEGYLINVSVEDSGMKTFSNANRNEDGQVPHVLPLIDEVEKRQDMFIASKNIINKEASLGFTHVNYDGSMDTRF